MVNEDISIRRKITDIQWCQSGAVSIESGADICQIISNDGALSDLLDFLHMSSRYNYSENIDIFSYFNLEITATQIF